MERATPRATEERRVRGDAEISGDFRRQCRALCCHWPKKESGPKTHVGTAEEKGRK